MKVRIITDSTADLTPEVRARIPAVPLTIHFGDDEYIDGVTISHRKFYEMLIESDVLPTTSQATPDAFAREFKKATDNGETVIAITVSSTLSGTYQSAMIAAEDFPEMVYVVDSKSVAIGTGILAEYALQLVDAGMSAEKIAARLAEERENVRVIALLDTLEYLKKGGRISKTAAVAGGILSIKPVITLDRNGAIAVLGKARGSRQGNNLLVKEIQASGGVDFSKPLLLGYTGLNDDLLQKYITDSAHLWEEHAASLRITPIGSVIGTHGGPGAIAAAYFKKN